VQRVQRPQRLLVRGELDEGGPAALRQLQRQDLAVQDQGGAQLVCGDAGGRLDLADPEGHSGGVGV
jgi:hypothetical protein